MKLLKSDCIQASQLQEILELRIDEGLQDSSEILKEVIEK
jgi:hypothetical protein|tara:strand:- start:10977 stop:11096 length:120 start_codon:yes stop_codon:yes gene_type:complete